MLFCKILVLKVPYETLNMDSSGALVEWKQQQLDWCTPFKTLKDWNIKWKLALQ